MFPVAVAVGAGVFFLTFGLWALVASSLESRGVSWQATAGGGEGLSRWLRQHVLKGPTAHEGRRCQCDS